MTRALASLFAALLLLASGHAWSQAAYVHELTGSATDTRAGAVRQLKVGDLLNAGATVATGAASSIVIKFEDGHLVALTERSSFRIEEYRYNKAQVRDSSVALRLLQGGMRFVTGVIGATNRDAVKVSAGTATIGIRGSDVMLTLEQATQAVTAAVLNGAVALSTPQGTQNVGPGDASRFTPGLPPTPAASLAQATGIVQQAFNNLGQQGLPINTPVVVQASAQAAVAAANAKAAAAQAAAQPGNTALAQAAQQAADQAQAALANAVQLAQTALQNAINAGAQTPQPPAGQSGTTSGTTGTPGTTGTTTGTTGSSTPTGSAGAGGGGTSSTTSTSPN